MTRDNVADLLLHLSNRDRGILETLRELRMLTTAQLRRLHFHHRQGEATPDEEDQSVRQKGHSTEGAAAVAAMRVLGRLEARGLVARLMRRIGGVRAGSSGIVWQLGATGERFLRVLYGDGKRRRYQEPASALFIDHTLAVAEVAVRLRELERDRLLEMITLQPEAKAWRPFLGPHGERSWLKPDLFAITASDEYEDHWFIEVDRSTEPLGVVLRKAQVYQRYAATGRHQAEHGLFPRVLWVVPDSKRCRAIEEALRAERGLPADMFQVITEDQLVGTLNAGNAETAQNAE